MTASDGFTPPSYAFQGGSNVDLAGGFGKLRVGRINQMVTETIWDFDPWYEDGITPHIRNPVVGGNPVIGYGKLPSKGRGRL